MSSQNQPYRVSIHHLEQVVPKAILETLLYALPPAIMYSTGLDGWCNGNAAPRENNNTSMDEWCEGTKYIPLSIHIPTILIIGIA
jgi:hypothetical protein